MSPCGGKLTDTGERSSFDSSPGLSGPTITRSVELRRLRCSRCKRTTLASARAESGTCQRERA